MEKEAEAIRLFKALEKEKIRYVIIGGMAVILYGVQRATFDIDIGILPEPKEVDKLLKLLVRLGYKDAFDADTGDFISLLKNLQGPKIIEMRSVKIKNGYEVDIMVIPSGTFRYVWEYRVEVPYKGATIPIPNLVDLIRLKEQAGRPIDIEDVAKLRHILRTSKKKTA